VQERFERDGYVTVPGLLDREAVQAARDDLERCRRRLKLDAEASIIAVQLDAVDFPAARLAWAAERVLQGPAQVFGFTYLCKPPGSGPPALWHQDGHPWADRLQGAPACTVWVALDDSSADNGCLRVIPGSHVLGSRPLIPATGFPNLFEVQTDPVLVDDARAVDLILAAGGACVHHPALIHGSGPNRSDRPRRALAVRYMGLVARAAE
jgi:phytanoyl-CoA hydroxylase